MKKFTLSLNKFVFTASMIVICIFSGFNYLDEQTVIIQNLLVKYYDNDAQTKDLKRYEINVTNNGFCRYRKIYNNGKQELFSFNLSSFKTMDYYGTGVKGELYLRTKSDDVIVQTRNDKNGDLDSMGTYIIIPLKNIDIMELNALSDSFRKFNSTMVGKN